MNKKILNATNTYMQAILLMETYHSEVGWKTIKDAKKQYSKHSSENSKLEAVKEQITIRVKGFGWDFLSYPWSKNGKHFTSKELFSYFVKKFFLMNYHQVLKFQVFQQLSFLFQN